MPKHPYIPPRRIGEYVQDELIPSEMTLDESNLAILAIQENAERHLRRFQHKNGGKHFRSPEHFVALVIEELGEYVRAHYDGDDLPALELIQAGGLIVNALQCFYTGEEIRTALLEEQNRHPG